jgi:integrase
MPTCTSFVSLLSSSGMPIEEIISHLVGHSSPRTTEKAYRKELRPVLTRGARAVDASFKPKRDRLASRVTQMACSGALFDQRPAAD